MRKTIEISAALLVLSGAVASAQNSPAVPLAEPVATIAPAEGQISKRDDCRAIIKQQGLKAQAASDQIQICMAQARLDCTKEAVSQNIPNVQRRDFIRTCINGDR